MKLYIKQKVFSIKGKFNIFDEAGDEKYTAEGEIFTLGRKLHVCDLNGNEVIFIRQKIVSLLPRYEISVQNSAPVEIVKKFTLLKHRYEIPEWDIEVEGNFIAHKYKISQRGQEIAQVDKEYLSWGDTYTINIYDPRNELIALATVLVADCCMESAKND